MQRSPLMLQVVSIGAAILALIAHKQNAAGRMWAMISMLVVFNPLVPIHLRRDMWRLIDLAAAVVFVAAAFMLRSAQRA